MLGFWETAVAMPTDYDLPFVVPPSQYIIYHLALSPHAFAVARVCAVLERCVSIILTSWNRRLSPHAA